MLPALPMGSGRDIGLRTSPAGPPAELVGVATSEGLIMRAQAGRVGWVDTAKGAAILLVIVWHAYLAARVAGDLPSWLDALNVGLANVRMPLFFLASGLLMERLAERPWEQLVRKRIAPLAWVLVLWTLIGSAVDLAVPLYPWEDEPLQGIAQVLWRPQGILWFVYALLAFAVLARVAATASGWRRVAVAAGLWAALVAYDAWRGEFHTRSLVQFFPFFMAGVLAAKPIRRVTASGWGLAAIAAVSLAGLAALPLAGVDGLAGTAGRNVLGTGLFVAVAAAAQRWPGLTRGLDAAGRRSQALFLGHMPVLAAAFALLPVRAADPVVLWLVLSVLSITGALLLERGARLAGLGWLYRVPRPVTGPVTERLGSPFGRTLAARRV